MAPVTSFSRSAAAGFKDVSVRPSVVYVDGSRPHLADVFIRRTFTAMIDGAREAALRDGLIDAHSFDRGIRDLERTAASDGVFSYTFFKVTGSREW